MNFSRRWFIGGGAALGAMQGCRVITDPAGLFRGGGANVKFGVISDVHVIASDTDRGTCGNTRTLEHTLKWFDSQGVDAVMVAGDIADAGLVSELQTFADAWFKVFPNDRSTRDGRKVERLFIYGNHDWEGYRYGYQVFGRKSIDLQDDWIADFGTKKTWERLFEEEYAPVYRKNVKGYDFIGAHWDGGAKANWSGMYAIEPWFKENGCRLDPSKPFFYFQHPHPKDTCYGTWAWGRDGGVSTRTLSAFPNAVAFSGHSHYSLVDERTVWQGAFTSLGTGSLRYAGTPDEEFPGEGYENTGGSKKDDEKTMERGRRSDARNGMLVSVYDDCTVFRRRDFRHDADLGPDWVLPHAGAEPKPFAFAEHARKSKAPEFEADAEVRAAPGTTMTRGARKSLKPKATKDETEKAKSPAVIVRFPAVKRTFSSIAWRYEISAEREDGTCVAKKRILAADFHLPAGSSKQSYTLVFLRSQLPAAGKLRFKVVPYDCFGNAGKGITSGFVSPEA